MQIRLFKPKRHHLSPYVLKILSRTPFVCVKYLFPQFPCRAWTKYTWFWSKFVHEIWVCPLAALAPLATFWSPDRSTGAPEQSKIIGEGPQTIQHTEATPGLQKVASSASVARGQTQISWTNFDQNHVYLVQALLGKCGKRYLTQTKYIKHCSESWVHFQSQV